MGHLKESLWIPLASFALAVLLSAAGASPNAGAVRLPMQATGDCTCQADVRSMEGNVEGRRAGGLATQLEARILAKVFGERPRTSTGSIKVEAFIKLKVSYTVVYSTGGGVTRPFDKVQGNLSVPVGQAVTFQLECPGREYTATFRANLNDLLAAAAAQLAQQEQKPGLTPQISDVTVKVDDLTFNYEVKAVSTCGVLKKPPQSRLDSTIKTTENAGGFVGSDVKPKS